jgi:uncharacterized protein DUF6308
MEHWVQVAGYPYSEEEARLVLAGYCFGTREEVQRTKLWDYRGERVHPFTATEPLPALRWFGYATYDCLDGSDGPALEPVDLLVPAALNGRLDVEVMAGLMAVREQVSKALEVQAEHGDLAFWELDPSELEDLDHRPGEPEGVQQPERASRLIGLYQAWWLLTSTPNVGPAITHKLLHHKLPRLAPLLDGQTKPLLSRQRAALGYSSNWAVILHDLTGQAEQFESLESFLAALTRIQGTKALFRLRIHDILLWCHAAGRRDRAKQLGEEVRRRSGSDWPGAGLPPRVS